MFGYLANQNNIDYNISVIMDQYYKNNNQHIINYDKSIQEYPEYVSKLNGVYKVNINYLMNKFYPNGTPSLNNSEFCNKYDNNQWDRFGVKKQTNNCLANNNSTTTIPNLPRHSPDTVPYTRSYDGQFSDILQNVGYNTHGYVIPASFRY